MTGQIIREKRRSLGLSQSDIAKELGCSQALISYWENSERDVHPKFLGDIRKIFRRVKKK